jgi:hypothetical protein
VARAKAGAGGAEYRLSVSPTRDERDNTVKTLFVLETVRQFSAFRYEISVREETAGNDIRFTILGLKAPGLNLPSSGSAEFRRAYALEGEYTVTVRGLDGSTVSFPLAVREGKPSLGRTPPPSFLDITVRTT